MLHQEIEEKKAYLRSYREEKRRLVRLQEDLDEYMSNKISPSSVSYDGIPGTSSPSDLSSYAVKLDEMERKIKKAAIKCNKKMQEISNRIEMMKKANEKDVLHLRYIEGLTWEEIGNRTGYDPRHVRKIHGWALLHFEMKEKKNETTKTKRRSRSSGALPVKEL